MVSLFSGGWGPGFAPVVQVEYRGDGDGDMAGFCGGEVQVLQRGHGCLHVCLGLFFVCMVEKQSHAY